MILGTWTLSNDEFAGVNNTDWLPASRASPAWEWAVTADKITLDGKSAVTYLVDTTPNPKTIDIVGLHPKYPDQVTRGIFKLDGDKLIVCVAKGGSKERPTDFSPKAPAARRYEFERKGGG